MRYLQTCMILHAGEPGPLAKPTVPFTPHGVSAKKYSAKESQKVIILIAVHVLLLVVITSLPSKAILV